MEVSGTGFRPSTRALDSLGVSLPALAVRTGFYRHTVHAFRLAKASTRLRGSLRGINYWGRKMALFLESARDKGPGVSNASSGFRADIQGLRAFAVLLVVANHLFTWPTGGYVGVDVFFVISGYLITGNLLREHKSTGWISISAFYARRLRRIMPVALVVALATIAAGYAIWFLPQANQTLLDGLASVFWVSNWHFAALGTDYLAASGPVSPFQHYWSLSVEEQFYVVMPWAILVLAWVGRRLPAKMAVSVLGGGLVLLGIASLAWGFLVTTNYPAIAYFDTISRSWEFVAGALVAFAGRRIAPRRVLAGKVLQIIGLCIIGASATILTSHSAFPAPGAILPVLGSVLVIVGGLGSERASVSLLTAKPAQYLGTISYSLYLWHFPVIIYLHALHPDSNWLSVVTAVALMLVLSHLSFKYVETPGRSSRWLRSWERRPAVVDRKWKGRQILAGSLVALTVLSLGALQMRGPAELSNAAALMPSESPAMDQCRNALGEANPHYCQYGDQTSDQKTLVLGDSVAVSWVPAVAEAWPSRATTGLGFASCSPFLIDTLPRVNTSNSIAACAREKERMFRVAEEMRPDVIVLSGDQGAYERQADGATGDVAAAKWSQAVAKTVSRYASFGATVIILPSPPLGKDVRSCSNRLSAYANCDSSISTVWDDKTEAERTAAAASGAVFVEIGKWFCSPQGVCPAHVGTTVVRSDTTHLTESMALTLGPKLAEAVGSRVH